uniref:Uncharacterized protein n=1 Tax=Rhipicephalus appendiculatus TaxID=34631 RepID=A0A131YEN8_RHIAP
MWGVCVSSATVAELRFVPVRSRARVFPASVAVNVTMRTTTQRLPVFGLTKRTEGLAPLIGLPETTPRGTERQSTERDDLCRACQTKSLTSAEALAASRSSGRLTGHRPVHHLACEFPNPKKKKEKKTHHGPVWRSCREA